ncbi:PorP/SprF family type IX secretion system membrane protein [Chitinophaga arvensicola]|uniref:Type IX secretion system membrane protein, PorP/SprF family n=1 Tax=Chitinophaga arvensicola TaxID=29529 RepID=A0A1I0RU72_9BACT|nr:PorP/SprF family type IX secretion system membrane protein [Chitinophaga arvensicola]SEW45003.1 type IX secretion system membrane protein, PorP/SprF family [Chitinophaga arvensicola]
MKKIFFIILLLAGTQSLTAQQWGNATTSQVDPLGSQYFQNQYLGNPAMAGIDTGLHLNAAYRKQWRDEPGVPVTMAITADYAAGKRVGVGLNVYNDKAGLLSNTRVAATYAYHLPLSSTGGQQLHFGLSVGFRSEFIDRKALNGDASDPSIGRFNRRDNYFDADFGLAYTSHGLNLQAALPNMIGYFKSDNKGQVNSSTFYSSASYRIGIGSQLTSIEPKVCFRGVRGFDNIIDLGANIVFLENTLNAFGMYHTSKNFTVGAGYNIFHTVGILVSYSSQTSGLSNYLSGNFAVGLKVDLFNKE